MGPAQNQFRPPPNGLDDPHDPPEPMGRVRIRSGSHSSSSEALSGASDSLVLAENEHVTVEHDRP